MVCAGSESRRRPLVCRHLGVPAEKRKSVRKDKVSYTHGAHSNNDIKEAAYVPRYDCGAHRSYGIGFSNIFSRYLTQIN